MKILGIIFICAIVVNSCDTAPKEKPKPTWNNEKSIRMNQELAMEQELDIRLYLEQHKEWQFAETGSGLRYVVLKETKGDKVLPGMSAKVQYSVHLLDGTLCYETSKDEYDVFEVDKSDVESGIHEGIKLMRVGERMKLIFPSHLAHGLIGDMNTIPPLSPLVVDIELIEIER